MMNFNQFNTLNNSLKQDNVVNNSMIINGDYHISCESQYGHQLLIYILTVNKVV